MPAETIEKATGEGATDTEIHFCPTNAALTLLNGRWTPHIVYTLLHGQTRFNEIAREIGINPRTLRERLRELEEDGVVSRRVISMMPPNVEYTLTEMGLSLEPIFASLSAWGIKWIPRPTEKPATPEFCEDAKDGCPE